MVRPSDLPGSDGLIAAYKKMGEQQEDIFTESMLEKRAPERQDVAIYSDLYDVGHLMLFMLYSSYEPQPDQPPGSWQEELKLSPPVRHLLECLFQIGPRYEHSRQFMLELEKALVQQEGKSIKIVHKDHP
ncbi:UNVERIFIED_CONTAM: hypothetical protein ABIC26_005089 [Paenibacillus sp. PvR008]